MTFGPAFGAGTGLSMPADEIYNGGLFDYNDLATSTTPISVTGGTGFVTITNDGLGSFTNKTYKPFGFSDIWNTSTNQFDWSDLSLGDMVDIRIDLEVTTTSPNQEVEVDLFLAFGDVSEYSIPFFKGSFKNADTHDINRFNGIYMGDSTTLSNPAEFMIASDDDCTVLVRGWYVKVIKRG
jgi:hypothetical protein